MCQQVAGPVDTGTPVGCLCLHREMEGTSTTLLAVINIGTVVPLPDSPSLVLAIARRDLRRRELAHEPDACRAIGPTSSPGAGCVGREPIGEHARTA
jgi:hypothetical protein